MAKRFTDTEKWDDPWYSELDNESKLMWNYICDKCSIGGIWKVNFKHIRFHCNSEKTDHQIKEIFRDRIHEVNSGKWFIPKFLAFQYPKGLNSNKPAIIAVRNEILSYNLESIINQSLGNHYLMIKDKDKDIDKDKDKGKSLRRGDMRGKKMTQAELNAYKEKFGHFPNTRL